MGGNPVSPVLQLLQLKTQTILDKLSLEPETETLGSGSDSITGYYGTKANDPEIQSFSPRRDLRDYLLHTSHFTDEKSTKARAGLARSWGGKGSHPQRLKGRFQTKPESGLQSAFSETTQHHPLPVT